MISFLFLCQKTQPIGKHAALCLDKTKYNTVWLQLHMKSPRILGGGGFAAFAGNPSLVSHHIRRQMSQKGFHVSAKAEDAEPLGKAEYG